MKKDELLKNWEKVVRNGKEETEKWILSLSNEDFNTLTKTPIIVQAKIHYKKLREEKITGKRRKRIL